MRDVQKLVEIRTSRIAFVNLIKNYCAKYRKIAVLVLRAIFISGKIIHIWKNKYICTYDKS